MSRRYNTKHPDRGASRYPDRLARRGVSSARVRMDPVEALRVRQERRVEQFGHPWPVRNEDAEALAETEAILADPDTMAAIAEARAEEAA